MISAVAEVPFCSVLLQFLNFSLSIIIKTGFVIHSTYLQCKDQGKQDEKAL